MKKKKKWEPSFAWLPTYVASDPPRWVWLVPIEISREPGYVRKRLPGAKEYALTVKTDGNS